MEMTTALINQWVINELPGAGGSWQSSDSVLVSPGLGQCQGDAAIGTGHRKGTVSQN